jgi:predicted nuclease of predicted toxin-antitoxin system
VKLLFDQNLSYRLCRNLADVFPGSEQAARAGLAEADDISVWNYAGRGGGLTVVTHDADFAEMAALRGPPPKVVWLRCSNQSTAVIEQLLRRRAALMESFLEDAVAACLELY